MRFKVIILFFGLLLQLGSVYAAELKDPTLRDEDISNTVLSVEYEIRPDGLYEYAYRVESPISNRGEILTFKVNLTCSEQFEPVDLPFPDGAEGYELPQSTPVGHTPTAVIGDYGSAFAYGLTEGGHASWAVDLQPGENGEGLRLISAAEPGLRAYTLEPYMDSIGWDYPEGDQDLPWIDDFTVSGMIAAPGCPGVTEPPSIMRFPGTLVNRESEEDNDLLAYASPEKDRIQVLRSKNFLEMQIFYLANNHLGLFGAKGD